MGASRPDDVPGDPSAPFPYSLWVLRGSFAAVSLEVMERREGVIPRAAQQSLRLALSSFVRGAEWGLLQPKPPLGSHSPQRAHRLSPADSFFLLVVLPSSPTCPPKIWAVAGLLTSLLPSLLDPFMYLP